MSAHFTQLVYKDYYRIVNRNLEALEGVLEWKAGSGRLGLLGPGEYLVPGADEDIGG
jgi:hypothetical protein